MVAWRSDDRLVHTTFAHLGDFLDARRPAGGQHLGHPARRPSPTDDGLLVHLSTELPGGLWLVELRRPDGAGSRPFFDGRPGRTLALPGGGAVELLAPYPAGARPRRPPAPGCGTPSSACRRPVPAYLARYGRPIRYGYAGGRSPCPPTRRCSPGSRAAPRCRARARPFTHRAGDRPGEPGRGGRRRSSSTPACRRPSPGEMPYPERYRVPSETAERVNAAHRRRPPGGRRRHDRHPGPGDGGRRAGPGPPGRRAGPSWSSPPSGGRGSSTGSLTGWHPPAGSHLLLVEAVGGRATVERSYAAAVERGYRWHEFGDVHLVLP